MLLAVVKLVQLFMKDFNDAKIVAITKIILNRMEQNGHYNS
jgi:hypothetical protein